MSEEIIPFSYNWNNKLDCNAFTTLRMFNNRKYQVGKVFNVVLKGQSKGLFKVVDIRITKIDLLNNFITYLDTGYSVEEAKNILIKMYPTANWDTQKLMFILLVKQS